MTINMVGATFKAQERQPRYKEGLQWTYDLTVKQLRKFFSPAKVIKPIPKYRAMKTKISEHSLRNDREKRKIAVLNSALLEDSDRPDQIFGLEEGLIQMPEEYIPRGQLTGSTLTQKGDHVDVSFDTGSDVSCIESYYLFKNVPNPKVQVSDEGISFSGIGIENTEVRSYLYCPLVIRLASCEGEILSFEAPQVWLVENVLTDYEKMVAESKEHHVHHPGSGERVDSKILLGADFLRPHGLSIVWGSKATDGLDCLRYEVPGTDKVYLFPMEMGKLGLQDIDPESSG